VQAQLSLYRFVPSEPKRWQTVACRSGEGPPKHYLLRPLSLADDLAVKLTSLARRLATSNVRETPANEVYLAIGVGPITDTKDIYVVGLRKEEGGPMLLHEQCWPLEEFEEFRDITP